ncbi:TetR/AcrR family transcriptional regulator [Methyloraptor flagellatus]|uniref:TetR/AcrR family transcriptional regulator n=1 Tax=Methyloraptor flagellatus TaxID=3162530 RepID=A0AAU7X732_9HYPH
MARTVGSSGPKTAEAIRAAGIRLIYEHGFEAMSLRQLAAEVGLQPGSLYKYFDTKQDLLFDIVREHLEDLLAKIADALDGIVDPVARLAAFAAFHLRYHMTLKSNVYIANMELRSLEPDNRAIIVAMRKRYEAILIDILREGQAAGALHAAEPRVAAFAILAMLTGICNWYRADGPMTQDELVTLHVDLVLGGVGAKRQAVHKAG